MYGLCLVIFIAVLAVLLGIGALSSRQKLIKLTSSLPKRPHYFTPQRPIQWFDFFGLFLTFQKVAQTTKTLSIIDRREIMVSYGEDNYNELLQQQGECWLDFMADTGDGFNSTASVLYAVSRDKLKLRDPDNDQAEIQMPRGKALIIGGDLVYPTADEQTYNDRFKGPLRLVYPFTGKKKPDCPVLLAMPGNHDWYDGLTAFSRMMCQQKGIGGYLTIQRRSYFIYPVFPTVHLFGLDNQLLGDIDIPQLAYFKNYVVTKLAKDEAHNIILFVAEPYWYDYECMDTGKRRQRMDSLDYFVSELKKINTRLKFQLVISGDIHHYARYENKKALPQQYITSGGGGAFKHMSSFLKPEGKAAAVWPCNSAAYGRRPGQCVYEE